MKPSFGIVSDFLSLKSSVLKDRSLMQRLIVATGDGAIIQPVNCLQDCGAATERHAGWRDARPGEHVWQRARQSRTDDDRAHETAGSEGRSSRGWARAHDCRARKLEDRRAGRLRLGERMRWPGLQRQLAASSWVRRQAIGWVLNFAQLCNSTLILCNFFGSRLFTQFTQ